MRYVRIRNVNFQLTEGGRRRRKITKSSNYEKFKSLLIKKFISIWIKKMFVNIVRFIVGFDMLEIIKLIIVYF